MILTENYSRQVYEKLRHEIGVAEGGRLKFDPWKMKRVT